MAAQLTRHIETLLPGLTGEAFPATIEVVATVPAPTISTDVTITPATIEVAASIPLPFAGDIVVVQPDAVVGTTTVLAPTLSTGATVTPATVAAVTTILLPEIVTGIEPPASIESYTETSWADTYAGALPPDLFVIPQSSGLWVGTEGGTISGFYYVVMAVMEFDTTSFTTTDANLILTADQNLSLHSGDFAWTLQVLLFDFGDKVETGDWRTPVQLQAMTVVGSVTSDIFQSLTAGQTLTIPLTDAVTMGGTTRLAMVSNFHRLGTTPTSDGSGIAVFDILDGNAPELTPRVVSGTALRLSPTSFVPIA